MTTVLVWSIAVGTIAGVLFRPKDWPEAVWACLGACLLVFSGLLPVTQAAQAVAKGTDVYLFLTGMMLLSEMARREGVFDWLASHAVAAARGSRERLFSLIYVVGIVVTVFLSNDATAVVLTPAVYAAVRRARTPPRPYLLICAFIANAASFVLPVSNPANLVVYGSQLPPLLSWLRIFLVPSLCSIAVTYCVLRWVVRADLSGAVEDGGSIDVLSKSGRRATWGIAATGVCVLGASAFGFELGLPTFLAAIIAVLMTTRARVRGLRQVAKGVAWSVLPLVAGLFVLVGALRHAGAMTDVAAVLQWCAGLPRMLAALTVSFGMAGLSNVMNNLPSGLLAGGTLQAVSVPAYIRDSVLIGVDLGPNLSVTGSLATVLWLIALRREGERISGWQFLKIGLMVMPPALIVATISLLLAY